MIDVTADDGSTRNLSERITIYHGTNRPYKFVKQGCWVTLAEEEAIGYARTHLVIDVVDGIAAKGEVECWLLEMRLERDQVDWKDGLADADFDGQHGTLRSHAEVLTKRLVAPFD